MYCPNKKSEEFKKMVEHLGEDLAYHIWDKNSGNPIELTRTGEPSELYNSLLAAHGNEKDAYVDMSKTFNNAFRKWYGSDEEPKMENGHITSLVGSGQLTVINKKSSENSDKSLQKHETISETNIQKLSEKKSNNSDNKQVENKSTKESLQKEKSKENSKVQKYARAKFMDGTIVSGAITKQDGNNISIKSSNGRTYTVDKSRILEHGNDGALFHTLSENFNSLKPSVKIQEVQKIITDLNGRFGIKTPTHVLLNESSVLNQMLVNGYSDDQIKKVKEITDERIVAGMKLGDKAYIIANNVYDTETLLKTWIHEIGHIHIEKIFTPEELETLYDTTGKEAIESIINKADYQRAKNIQADEAIAYSISDLLNDYSIEDILNNNYDNSKIPLSLQEPVEQTLKSISNENSRNKRSSGRNENELFMRTDRRAISEVRGTDGKEPGNDTEGSTGHSEAKTIEIDGKQRTTTNSLGKPIHGTEEGIRNFWKWFGDSKVVDAEGRPLVVYHGTNSEFNEFKRHKTEEPTFWFTQDKERAGRYGNLIEVYLKAINPKSEDIMPNTPSTWENADAYVSYVDNNPTLSKFTKLKIEKEGKNVEDVLSKMPKKGDIFSIVVSSPTQIKSATGNDGSFDPNNADIRYQIIGEKGASELDKAEEATHRLDNLGVAKEMETTKNPQEIRLATGWEKGIDGKWRYEVADGKLTGTLTEEPVSLSEVWDSEELFKAYPQLKDIQINSAPFDGKYSAVYYPDENRITVHESKNGSIPKTANSFIVHEIQHAIQEIEGFATGSTVDSEIDKIRAKANELTFDEYKSTISSFETEIADKTKELAEMKSSTRWNKTWKAAGIQTDINKLKNELSKLVDRNVSEQEAFDNYRKSAGEVEARNASERMNMTPEERRNTLLAETADVAPEDQIVLMDGMGISNSESAPEKPKYAAEKSMTNYADEILKYNNEIKAIEDKKKALNQEHDDKQISNKEFAKEVKKLNDDKFDIQTKVKRIKAGTATPEDFQTAGSDKPETVSSEKSIVDKNEFGVDVEKKKTDNNGSVISGNTMYVRKPRFSDFGGDLMKFVKEIDEYNRQKADEKQQEAEKVKETTVSEQEPQLKDFVGRPYSEYESALNQYRAANKVLRSEKVPENKKEYRNILQGLKTAKDEVVSGDIPEIRTLYSDLENEWLGNRDVEKAKAMIGTKKLQDEIKQTVKDTDQKWQDVDKAIHVYIDMKNDPTAADTYYEGLKPEQQHIVDIAKALTPEQQAIAEKIAKDYEDLGKKALEEEVISTILDNYVRRQWDTTGEQGRDFFGKFSTSTSHAKHRKLNSIIEGWASGLELKTEGATNNLQALKEEINSVIENKKLLKAGMAMKGDNGVPLFTLAKETGYEEIKHPNFRKWVQWKNVDSSNNISGENWAIDKDGNIFEKKKIYAPKPVAERINNILTAYNNGLNGIAGNIVNSLDKLNAGVKSTILSFSFYHHQAFARQYMFGAAFNKAKDANLFSAYKDGFNQFMNMGPEVEMLIRNGMTVGRIQDWQEDLVTQKGMIAKVMDQYKVTKSIQDTMHNLHEMQTNFLFNYYGIGLKMKMATTLLHEQMTKYPDEDVNTIAKRVGEFANNSFGGLNVERYGRSKKLQKWLHRVLLAPDWTESNLKAMLKTVGFDYTKFGEEGYKHGFNNDKEQAKRERQLYQKLWAKTIVRTNIVSAIWNMLIASSMMALLSDKKDDSWLDEIESLYKDSIDPLLDFSMEDESFMSGMKKIRDVAVKSHFMDADVTFIPKGLSKLTGKDFEDNQRYYFSTMGHFKDPAKWIIDPTTSAKHKASVVFKIALDAMNGKDWQGKRFTTIDEFLGTDNAGVFEKSNKKKGIHKGDSKSGKLRFQTVKYGMPSDNGAVQLNELPSFIMNELLGTLPVLLHNALNLTNGELDAFTTMTRGIGMNVSSEKMKDHEELKYDVISKKIKSNEAIVKGIKERAIEAQKKGNLSEMADYITKYNESNSIIQSTLNGFTNKIKEIKTKLPDVPEENQERIADELAKLKKRVIELYSIKDEKQFKEKLNQYEEEEDRK